MSELRKSRNLFLEKEELERWDRFIVEDGQKEFMRSAIVNGGIVPTTKTYPYSFTTNFQVIQGSDYKKINIAQNSLAYDTQGNRIHFPVQSGYELSLPFTAGGVKSTWIHIEAAETSIELGTISLAANGALTGAGTKFTEVFRGQSSLVPNKIRIYERTPVSTGGSGYSYSLVGTYEVTEITDDENMLINTENALGAGTFTYSVVGAFSPGSYSGIREEEIYSYDFVNFVFSSSSPSLSDDQYLLAKVTVNDSLTTLTIEDLREDVFALLSDSSNDYAKEIINSIPERFSGRTESTIIKGCIANKDVSTDTLSIASGKVEIGGVIYPVNTHLAVQSAPTDTPYWELWDDAGTTKARVVYAAAKLATYYNYNQNYRLNSRRHSMIIDENTNIVNESGYFEGRVEISKKLASTGDYYIKIDGSRLQGDGSSISEKNYEKYLVSASVRNASTQQYVYVDKIVDGVDNYLGLTVVNSADMSTKEDLSDTSDITIEKISSEE